MDSVRINLLSEQAAHYGGCGRRELTVERLCYLESPADPTPIPTPGLNYGWARLGLARLRVDRCDQESRKWPSPGNLFELWSTASLKPLWTFVLKAQESVCFPPRLSQVGLSLATRSPEEQPSPSHAPPRSILSTALLTCSWPPHSSNRGYL